MASKFFFEWIHHMTIIGIDLGTTNSLVAIWQDEKAQLIPNALNKFLTPSVVGLNNDGEIIVGEIAKQRLETHSDITASNFKCFMGTHKILKLGKKKFRAEELSALVLKSLKADAEAFLNTEINTAIISVPAYFSDAQRKATKAAGQLAGLNVIRLINEPTAAAIAYGLHEKPENCTFLVFDIGGGTFDVSIMEMFDGVMQVNASSGDNRLGGEDFVELLIKEFIHHHDLKIEKLKSKELAKLHASAEQCKQQLSTQPHADMQFQAKHQLLTLQINRDQFNELSKPLLKRLRAPLERALNDADLNGDELDAVILAGGASRMPIIRSLASKMLGLLPTSHINPDQIVALGTAIQAGLIQNDDALKEIVLTDVSPYTLGIDVINENSYESDSQIFYPIIERNSSVPISRSDLFSSAHNNQPQINIGIFQGESRHVRNNIKLGELNINIPRSPAGKESIEVRFTYDINGLLEVETLVISTGKKKTIVIEGNPGVMTEKEINQRLEALAELKIHPRDKLENTTLLARGERLYENSLGEKREIIGELLQQFEAILKSQNIEDIEKMSSKLKDIFDDIENNSPLC